MVLEKALWFYEEPSPTGDPFWKWCLKETSVEGSLRHLYKVLGRTLKGNEPWYERFFVESKMVLLWHHSEEPFLVPGGTFIVLYMLSFLIESLPKNIC